MVIDNNNFRIEATRLILLKHKEFNPQLAGVMETKLRPNSVEMIKNSINDHNGVRTPLQIQLANSLDVNLSKGRIASVPNGWNNERFSFLLVVNVFDNSNNQIISEEIYQGYTDYADTAGGRLEAGASVRIDPNTMMYVNRVLDINYGMDGAGNLIPTFHKSDTILADNTYDNDMVSTKQNLLVMRPSDIALMYHNQALENETENTLTITNTNMFNRLGKFSKLDNEVGGRTLTKLINAASRSNLEPAYSFGSTNLSQYENMLSELVENNANKYKLLRAMGERINVSQLSKWTVEDLHKMFPKLTPDIFTVESYNDSITRNTNTAFQLGNTGDKGDSILADTQLARFQKRIVPYLFDAMLSFGFVQFSGKITNKTIDGSIHLEHSILMNISNVVNSNTVIRNQVMRLLYGKLTDPETKAILSNDGTQSVEVVFDLSLTDSSLFINLNNHITRVKIPSLCDNTFSSLVMDSNSSNNLVTELKTVVSSILDSDINVSANYGW